MAKAIQTNAWLSLATARRIPLFYSPEFIEACLQEVRSQADGWTRWFETNKLDPFVVHYEDLLADNPGTVRKIVQLVGAEGDQPDTVVLPDVQRQSDHVNAEWIRRFKSDVGCNVA
jgi:LPS sulfotransferase NodH